MGGISYSNRKKYLSSLGVIMHLFGKSAFQTVFQAQISSSVDLIALLNPHPVSLQYMKRVSIYFLLGDLGLHCVGRFGPMKPVKPCFLLCQSLTWSDAGGKLVNSWRPSPAEDKHMPKRYQRNQHVPAGSAGQISQSGRFLI